MPEELSDELIIKIREHVKRYKSKIDTANKFELSYDTVLHYTRDIRIKTRKNDAEYLGINGKSLDLLKELMKNGYAFSSKIYNTTHYIKLKKYFPNIRRTKIYGKMIYYLDDESKIAAMALLEVSNKKIMNYHDLSNISRIFNIELSSKEKKKVISNHSSENK